MTHSPSPGLPKPLLTCDTLRSVAHVVEYSIRSPTRRIHPSNEKHKPLISLSQKDSLASLLGSNPPTPHPRHTRNLHRKAFVMFTAPLPDRHSRLFASCIQGTSRCVAAMRLRKFCGTDACTEVAAPPPPPKTIPCISRTMLGREGAC